MLLKDALRCSLFFLLLTSSYAFSQEDEEESASDDGTEEVVVTGSRIKRSNFETNAPVTVITSEDIENRGYTKAAEALFALPFVGIGASNYGDSAYDGSEDIGQNIGDSFGLGAQRTLTLVNGKRFVSGNSAIGSLGSAVDTNNIPNALIERVEVKSVGGAAVYGADAVAGVINFILKEDYEGFEFSYDYNSLLADFEGAEEAFRSLMGFNSADGRGNFVLSLEMTKTPRIDETMLPYRDDYMYRTTLPDAAYSGQSGFYPEYRLYGLSQNGFATCGSTVLYNRGAGLCDDGFAYEFDNNGNLTQAVPGGVTGNAVWSVGGAGLYLDQYGSYSNAYDRYNVSSFYTYDLNFAKFKTEVYSSQYETFPTVTQPQYQSGLFGGTAQPPFLPLDYPFFSQQARDLLATLTVDGEAVEGVYLQWAPLSWVPRPTNASTTTSFNFSLEGEVFAFDRGYDWQVGYSFGKSKVLATETDYIDGRFFAAIDVGINPDTGEIDCRFNYVDDYANRIMPTVYGNQAVSGSLLLGAPGDCVPVQPFGYYTPSQAQLDYVTANIFSNNEIDQIVRFGNVQGPLFDLPAGEVLGLVGFEQRKEAVDYRVDGGSKADVYRAGYSADISGAFSTSDVYYELFVPLLGNGFGELSLGGVSLLKGVDLEYSFRELDNSLAGVDEADNLGLNIRFTDDLRIRLNQQNAVRAPSMGELFQPVVAVSSFVSDPCDQSFIDAGPNPEVRRANCLADAQRYGVDITNWESFAKNASVAGRAGGNVNLANESAEAQGYGLVFQPSFVPGELSLAVDKIVIDIEDAITSYTATQIMNACYDSTSFPNNPFCGQFFRGDDFQLLRGAGEVAYIAGQVNAAIYEYEATISELNYFNSVADFANFAFGWAGLDLGDNFGDFQVNVKHIYNEKDLFSATGSDINDNTGQFGSSARNRFYTQLQHFYGSFVSYIDVFYYGEGKFDNNWDFSEQPDKYVNVATGEYLPNHIEGWYMVNAGVNVDASAYGLDGLILRFRVNNLLDWQATSLWHRNQLRPDGESGTNYGPGSGEGGVIGQRLSFGFNYSF